MELTDLQNIWTQYEKNITENTRINREILRKIILSKTERKINWMKFKAIFNLIIPIPMVIYIFIDLDYRNDKSFFIGLILSSLCFILTYSWALRYYLLVDKIDFSNAITTIKLNLNKLEKYKLKITKLGLIVAPFFIAGIFLLVKINVLSPKMIPFYSLTLLVMGITFYLTYKYGIITKLSQINSEIEEIISLEKE